MVSTIDSSPRRISVVPLICGLVALAMAHAAYTFVLYRARALTHSSHCIIGFPSVRFTRDCRLLRIFLLAASPSGSHHSAVGWSISAHGSFVLVEPSPPIQHLWNVAPRGGCMERHHLTRRWSERPPVVRSRLVSLQSFRSGPRAPPVAVAHLILV
jgi:hypothetical protein